MRARPLYVGLAVASLALAIASAAAPRPMITRAISASMDIGWYARVPFAEIEPGAIISFPIPPRARALAEQAGLSLDIPLMKRVEIVTPDGRLIVKGDCGGSRSLDSQYFGAISRGEVLGVFAPIPWGMTPCRELIGDERKEGKEAYRKESLGSQIKRFHRKEAAALPEQPLPSTVYPYRKPLREVTGSYRKLTGA